MQVAALAQRVYERLGREDVLYPQAEVLANGLTPAQNLLCLLEPTSYIERYVATLNIHAAILDLRSVAPRAHTILRCVLGEIPADVASFTQGEYHPIHPTTRAQLAWRRNWWQHTGTPDRYWRLGRHMIGFYRRPIVAVSVTLVTGSIPPALTVDDLDDEPRLDPIQHPLMADVAAQLLLIKEGAGEAERAMTMLGQLLGVEDLTAVAKVLRRLQRDTVPRRETTEAMVGGA